MAADDNVPIWDASADALEKFKEDISIFVASTAHVMRETCGPRILAIFAQGSVQRAIGLTLLKSGDLVKDDGPGKLWDAIYAMLGTQVEADVASRFGEYIRKRGRQFEESMQHYLAEEERIYARALDAVKLVQPDVTVLICSPHTRVSSFGAGFAHCGGAGLRLRRHREKLQVRAHEEEPQRHLGQRGETQAARQSLAGIGDRIHRWSVWRRRLAR